MELWIGALNLGFLYSFMTMGVFLTFRIHDFPDITVDGSFTSGAAAAALLIVAGVNPLIALIAAFVIGAAAGAVTALIHTRFNINGLLAGILVMTGLYSINLHIMGRSNIPLLNQNTFLSYLDRINPGLPPEEWIALVLLLLMVVFWLLAGLFFKTDLGISMRATGNNPTMGAAAGVNVARMKIFGVALSNGLVGVSGGLVAQYQGFADIGMGIGTIVIGLAAVIIGESLIRMHSLYARVLSVIVGSVIFRMMIAGALFLGMNPIDLKLLTAVFVLATLIASKALAGRASVQGRTGWLELSRPELRRIGCGTAALVIVALCGWTYRTHVGAPKATARAVKIGVLQVSDHGLLNITRDSLVGELERLGYKNGAHCTIYLENANGDLPTVNTILDKFVQERMDVIVPISTPCTQAAINKVKNRPVVFATVANPFIIGVGKSEADHLPNVTGVYGWAPMDKTLELVHSILPGPLRIGTIWDPAHANSVFNVSKLEEALKGSPDVTLVGTTINNSSEVYQAALALVQKDIDVFVLVPDNIVYSAFESVVKAARSKHIPIFLSDVERLGDGALGVLGYDYTSSGIQAAHLVDRVLKGENPRDIPIERYSKLSLGINLELAKELGVTVPQEVLNRATIVYGGETRSAAKAEQKRLALFAFSDNSAMEECISGVMQELQANGILKSHNIKVEQKNAQNEFHLAQSIAQDIVRQDYDYIITLSTPALQVTAQTNKKIPHIFGCVSDPYRMGVAENAQNHLANLTGVATMDPIDQTFAVMRQVLPDAKTVGMVWNPAEACSEACTLLARQSAPKYGFELREATVSNTSEVMDAVNSLVSRGVDAFLTSGDNTVIMAVSSIGQALKSRRIPYFTNLPSAIERGSLVSVGADFNEVGRQTAKVVIRVLNGEEPRNIPILDFAPDKIYLNDSLAQEYGLTFPQELVHRAAKIVR